ncbi:MAG: type VI secretion system tip protein VgrG, partial [Deltaproteobacteria bacterium]|nr:type VI secretion system tip protein VgrG [Nannocystaceae bacterium]
MFELSLPDGPDIAWRVVRLQGTEALSAPFELLVDLTTEELTADYDAMLGATCELMFDRIGAVRTVYGIIDEVRAVMSAESGVSDAVLAVRVRIVPAFKLLDQQVDTRFFAGQTVVEIVRDVLTPALELYGRTIDVTSSIKGTYNKRDYCVQFRESTFAFCSRILEEEGIAYHFVGDDDERKEKLVLIDNNANYGPVDLVRGDDIPIVLSRFDELDRESLQGFDWRAARTPNHVSTRGYNLKVPTPPDEGEAVRTDSNDAIVREQYFDDDIRQIVDDPVGDPEAQSFTGADLAQRQPLAKRRLERHNLDASVGFGHGNAIGFAAGVTFTLGHHPREKLEHHQFLLISVRYEGAAGEGGTADGNYSNTFECIPIENEFRPALRTRRPRVHGIQTGVVVGRAKEEIHTDKYGRIRVKFHRDRYSDNDEHASCWMRVAQVWAGSGFGGIVIPRVGMEVVVSFVDGNPDCPIVTGCVYDGTNMPPYPLPAEKTKSTFKTSTSPIKKDGFNELRFEDASGHEQVFIHAQRRMDMRIRGSLYETCGGN